MRFFWSDFFFSAGTSHQLPKKTHQLPFFPPKFVFQGLGFCSPVYAAPRSPRSWIAMTQVLNLNLLVVLRPMQVIKVVNPKIERGPCFNKPRSWWGFGRWFKKCRFCQSVMEPHHVSEVVVEVWNSDEFPDFNFCGGFEGSSHEFSGGVSGGKIPLVMEVDTITFSQGNIHSYRRGEYGCLNEIKLIPKPHPLYTHFISRRFYLLWVFFVVTWLSMSMYYISATYYI